MKVETVPWQDLHQHPDNPRNGDVEAIKESVLTNGVYRPVIVSKDNTILAGHHLWMALGELGRDAVDVVRVDVAGDSPEARRILLADNRTADLGNYDPGLLVSLLESLDTLDGTGYAPDDLSALLREQEKLDREVDHFGDRDYVPTVATGRVKNGDKWLLGEHVLVCGDASDPANYEGEFDGIITDPPYGINYDGGRTQRDTLASDDQSALELLDNTLDAVPLMPGGICYVFTASGPIGVQMLNLLVERGLSRWVLTWVKSSATFGRMDYKLRHEFLSYGWLDGAAHTKVTAANLNSVLEYDRASTNKDHPTQKPVALVEALIDNHAWREGARLVDPFSGSGTTLIAAIGKPVSVWAVEKEPAYCDVIVRRFEQATGIIAEQA